LLVPTLPAVSQDPAVPTIKPPKLSSLEKRSLNNALKPVQEWVAANKGALAAQAHSAIDRGVKAAVPVVHKGVDSMLGAVTGWLASLRF
jgi:hypothetical protein